MNPETPRRPTAEEADAVRVYEEAYLAAQVAYRKAVERASAIMHEAESEYRSAIIAAQDVRNKRIAADRKRIKAEAER